MAKITRADALKLLKEKVDTPATSGYKLLDAALPKLQQLNKQLGDELKKAESREMVDTLVKGVKLQVRPVSEGVTLLTEGLRHLKEITADEDVFAVIADDLTRSMTKVTAQLEAARNELRAAKLALDQAGKYLGGQDRDADSAGEDWAAAMMELKRLIAGAFKELDAWRVYDREGYEAMVAYDKARLDKVLKARPSSAMIDTLINMPKGNPFHAFDRTYDLTSLPATLRVEIMQDRVKAIGEYGNALSKLAGEIAALKENEKTRVIKPRDGRKALAVLGLPSAALPKLQAALDGLDRGRMKKIADLCKKYKVNATLSESDLWKMLVKAGVLPGIIPK